MTVYGALNVNELFVDFEISEALKIDRLYDDFYLIKVAPSL